MKKIKVIAIMVCVVLLGCNKTPDVEGSVTSTLPSDYENMTSTYERPIELPTSSVVEITINPGIMPNTAGIVVLDMSIEETTKPEPEVLGVELGVANENKNKKYSSEEDAGRLGVTKVLVCMVPATLTWNMDADIMSRLNELLVKEYDCDFVVEFVGIDGLEKYWNYTYEILAYSKNMNEHVDVMVAMAPAYYSKLVREGFFMDMTEYLDKTDDGKKFYNSYAEEVWEQVMLGEQIYGYTPDNAPCGMYAVVCNKDVANRLGLDVKQGFSFYDIEKILENVDFSTAGVDDVAPVYMDAEGAFYLLEYINMDAGIFAKKDSGGNWVAFNLTEDEAFITLCKTIRKYKEKGWLRTGTSAYKSFTKGNFIFAAKPFGSSYLVEDKLRVTVSDATNKSEREEIYSVVTGQKYGYYNYSESFIYGVTSWSEYQEEALKFLMLLNTEKELSNLLAYGIENDHYTYRDNVVIKLPSTDGRGMGDFYTMVNPNLLLPQYVEEDDKVKYYKELSASFERGAVMDAFYSIEEWNDFLNEFEQLNALQQIYEQGYEKLINGDYEDVDAAIAEISRLQREAGINEIIEAYNTRFSTVKK